MMKHTLNPGRWITFVSRCTGAAAIAAGGLLLGAQSAYANNCLQDEYSLVNQQTLGCTANDVRVARVINVRNLDGSPRTDCIAGSKFDFIADYLVQTTSSSSRSNIGLYFGIQGSSQATALSGLCSDNIIPPTHTCDGSSISCGSTSYSELDPQVDKQGNPLPDNCGDTSSNDPTVCLNADNKVVTCPAGGGAPLGGSIWPATQIVTVEINNFTCEAPTGTSQLVLPNCTSWQVPGKTIQCVANAPNYDYPLNNSGKPEAIPGSPSKCNCATIPLPITVQSPSASVAKDCTLPDVAGQTNLTTCAFPTTGPYTEGGDVKYTVTVTNSSNFGDINVDQICDSAYGNVFTVSGYTGAACSAGSQCSAPNNVAGANCITGTNTCSTGLTVPDGGPPNNTASCNFTVTQGEKKVVSNTVTVKGRGASAGTFGPNTSNSVSVSSNEAPSTATITKGMDSTTSGCATVRYTVDIANTSGFDENLSLTAMSDSYFSSITTVHGSGDGAVLGTTCGVANTANSLGTLAGVCGADHSCKAGTQAGKSCTSDTDCSPGAGVLPYSLPVGGTDYTCAFDAQFCGGLATIALPNGNTCSGIQNTDSVSGTFTGDESADSVTVTKNTFTVYECFSSAIQSTTP